MPRRRLRGLERLTVPLLDGLNQHKRVKSGVHAVIGRFSIGWITWCTRNLWQLHGIEKVAGIEARRGVILVSNHRSFFDMFIGGCVLSACTPHFRRFYFPVRKNYFYDSPLGPVVNIGISGGSMWPPVFRDERRDLNRIGLAQLADVLHTGSVVGIHPEGRRSKSDDPYTLRPARPGLGRLVRVVDRDTLVLPYFILGVGNDVKRLIRRNFRPAGERGEPVRLWFGEPIRAEELQRITDPQQITDTVMERIVALGAKDRAARQISDADA